MTCPANSAAEQVGASLVTGHRADAAANRLSRNPVESAKLQWLLQEIVIQSIVTHEREYLPSDNAILFSIESGMANQYILELRANSRRGVLSKVSRGWFPGMARHTVISTTNLLNAATGPSWTIQSDGHTCGACGT